MNPESFSFQLLKILLEAYDKSTWTYRHPWSVLSSMPEYQKLKRKKIYDGYYYLLKKKYLCKLGERYELTDKARKLIKLKNLEELVRIKKKAWDKKWRIVIFDIPEIMRARRKQLRGLLGRLGFRKIQKSVWLTPYDFLGEVEELAREENLLKFLLLIETQKLSRFLEFEKEFFGKNKSGL